MDHIRTVFRKKMSLMDIIGATTSRWYLEVCAKRALGPQLQCHIVHA